MKAELLAACAEAEMSLEISSADEVIFSKMVEPFYDTEVDHKSLIFLGEKK